MSCRREHRDSKNPRIDFLSVLVRGDVRVGYGDVYEVVKIAKECNVKHLGLVSKEN